MPDPCGKDDIDLFDDRALIADAVGVQAAPMGVKPEYGRPVERGQDGFQRLPGVAENEFCILKVRVPVF